MNYQIKCYVCEQELNQHENIHIGATFNYTLCDPCARLLNCIDAEIDDLRQNLDIDTNQAMTHIQSIHGETQLDTLLDQAAYLTGNMTAPEAYEEAIYRFFGELSKDAHKRLWEIITDDGGMYDSES